MIGYETSQSRLYAYARDRKIMMREANGLWQSVLFTTFEEDSLLSTWTNAIIVPEQATAELDRITPHASYRINTWGGMYLQYICNNSFSKVNGFGLDLVENERKFCLFRT